MAALSITIPAPVGGWNARDSIAEMDGKDAPVLTNMFPATTECILRLGFSKWSTGYPSQVETIFSYAGATTDKLFGVSNGAIYDATAGGAIGAAAVSGLSNSRFQYVNMSTSGGNYLFAVNGADKARYFDGSTWSADGGTFTITVADTSKWISCTLHKQRIWGIEKSSLKAYYLPTQSVAGAASLFDLSSFFKLGGYLVGIETWTVDGGTGVDDYLVFATNKGEILVYQGTDPSSASTWAMKGLWRIGAPVGNRCFYKYQGDLLIISQDGLMPLSGALQSSRVNPRVALSNKIQFAVSDAVSSYGANFGWQVIYFPKENQLYLNVPVSVGRQQQFVMNTISGSWCNYVGWPANCWEIWKDNPYFGGSNYIGKAWDTYADAGANITFQGLQAFSDFKSPGVFKRFTRLRPVFRTDGQPAVLASVNLDYDQTLNGSAVSYSPGSSAGVWGSGVWGSALWGSGTLSIVKNWQGASGIGYTGAPQINGACNGVDVRWVSTDIQMERGAVR